MKKVSFESAISELENIVAQMENGETSLQDSLKLFERGTKLAAYCYTTLQDAEQKIVQLSALEEEASRLERED